jgi:dTDP-4-dehydrorhamnose 3,5-epimerase
MEIKYGKIKGIWIIEPKILNDDRGYFFESFKLDVFKQKTNFKGEFVQENESLSSKGVLRGLHFQKPPTAQSKLIRVVQGSVLDVVVDIRENSPFYGQFEIFKLDSKNKKMIFVPEGFAHGFQTLEDNTIFQYKCSNYYNKEHDGGILWSDDFLNIPWFDFQENVISEKDKKQEQFKTFKTPFKNYF